MPLPPQLAAIPEETAVVGDVDQWIEEEIEHGASYEGWVLEREADIRARILLYWAP